MQQGPQQLQQPQPFQQMQPAQLGAPRPMQQPIGIVNQPVQGQFQGQQNNVPGAIRPVGFGQPAGIPQQLQQQSTSSLGVSASNGIGVGTSLAQTQRPLSSGISNQTGPTTRPNVTGAPALQPLGIPSLRPALIQQPVLGSGYQSIGTPTVTPTVVSTGGNLASSNPSLTAMPVGIGSTRPSFQQIQPANLLSSGAGTSSPSIPGQLNLAPRSLGPSSLTSMHISANAQPIAAVSATPTATPILTPSLALSTPNNTPRVPTAIPGPTTLQNNLSGSGFGGGFGGGPGQISRPNTLQSMQQPSSQTFPASSSSSSSSSFPSTTSTTSTPLSSQIGSATVGNNTVPPSSSSNFFGQPVQAQSSTTTPNLLGASSSSQAPVVAAMGLLKTQQQQLQGQLQGMPSALAPIPSSTMQGSQFQKQVGPPTSVQGGTTTSAFPAATINNVQQPAMKTSGPPMTSFPSQSASASSSAIAPPPVPMAAFLSQGPPTTQSSQFGTSGPPTLQQQQPQLASQSTMRFGSGPPLQQQLQQQQQPPTTAFPSGPPTSSSSSGGPPRTAGPPSSSSAGPPMFQQQQHQQSGPPLSQGGPPQGGPPQGGPPQGGPPQGMNFQQQQQQQQVGFPGGPPSSASSINNANSGPGGLVSPPKSVGGSSTASSSSSNSAASSAPRIDPTQIPRPRYTNPASPVRYNTTDHLMNTPPFAWSDFIAEDSGSCNPRFVRSTLGHVPASKEVLRETKLPLAVIVTPLAKIETGERETNVVDFGEEGPPRCGRCRGYVNKFSRWNTSDGGRSWSCNLCGLVNETPQWYQCHNGVDQYGDRNDKHERPELMFGSVEFTAPASYLVEGRTPSPLCVAFIIDVSLPALTSGLLQAASNAILSAVPSLERSSGGLARIGIIAFDSEIHFFDMKTKKADGSISQATVCDVNEAFCPLSLSQWTGSLSDAGTLPQLEHLLSRLPHLFQPNITRPKQSVSGAALKAAVEGLGDSGGRVVMFQAQLPLSGEGSLQVRESPKSYGTDKEKEMYSPATGDAGKWYSELAKDAASKGVCIDLHICTPPGAYCDLPTQATLSARTGGEMIVYPYFFPPTGQGSEPTQQRLAPINVINEEAQNRMNFDLACKLGREYGTEAVLKVRTSPGLRTHKYVGNFEDRADNEADLAGVDSEKSILITLQHDGADIKNGDDMFVQAALLFTNARGQRRVRIHNLKMVAADTVQSVFRHADVDAILSHMLRVSVQTTLTKDAKFVEKDLEETSIDMLYAYRKHCATNSSQGQLILPESLKLLPLYLSTVLKLQAFAVNSNRSGKTSHSKTPFGDINVRVDARLVELVALSSISPGRVVPFLYPRMFRVDNLAAQYGIPVPLMQQQQLGGIDIDSLPPPRPSSELSVDELRTLVLPSVVYPSIEQINSNPNAMFLVDHRFGIFLVVGSTVDEDSFVQVFGGASINAATLPPNTPLVMYDSDLSKRIWSCIAAIKMRRDNLYMPVSVISSTDAEGRELLKGLMVEDKGKSGGKSYVEILCDIHTSIQSKLMST